MSNSKSAQPDTGPRITISICTYDRYDVLPKAIESALAQTLPPASYQIIVVDNSPDSLKAEAFGDRFSAEPRIRYLVERTPGLSNARNVSARESGTEYLAFMDDDAIAAPDWLEQILEAFDQYAPRGAVVGGQVQPIWERPRPPWLHDSMLGNVSVVNWGGVTRETQNDEWFAGTNIAFRTETILRHGGFPINLGRIGSGASLLSNEEVWLLEQVKAAGGALIYAPEAKVRHLVESGRLERSWFRRRAAWQAVSDFMMDPKKYRAAAVNYWPGVTSYFNKLPPHLRTIRGLGYVTDDPDLFKEQSNAFYMITMMLLSGFYKLPIHDAQEDQSPGVISSHG